MMAQLVVAVAVAAQLVAMPSALAQLALQGEVRAPEGDLWFGNQVTVDGRTLLVTSFAEDDADARSGRVYLYALRGAEWELEATLAKAVPSFAASAALGGQVVAVGAPAQGVVYLFEKVEGEWTEVDTLSAPLDGVAARFGETVSVAGFAEEGTRPMLTNVVVGAPLASPPMPRGSSEPAPAPGTGPGGVFTFQRRATGWTPVGTHFPEGSRRVGSAVAMNKHGDVLVAGKTPSKVFTALKGRDDSAPYPALQGEGDLWGSLLAFGENNMAVAASPFNPSVSVIGGEAAPEEQQLALPKVSSAATLPKSLALGSRFLAVGAPGGNKVFAYDAQSLELKAELTVSGAAQFGRSVGSSGPAVAVAARTAVFVFADAPLDADRTKDLTPVLTPPSGGSPGAGADVVPAGSTMPAVVAGAGALTMLAAVGAVMMVNKRRNERRQAAEEAALPTRNTPSSMVPRASVVAENFLAAQTASNPSYK